MFRAVLDPIPVFVYNNISENKIVFLIDLNFIFDAVIAH